MDAFAADPAPRIPRLRCRAALLGAQHDRLAVVGRARPNGSHVALARLGSAGRIERLVTQNVDGLHQRAGSGDVIELHGGIDGVTCLGCGAHHARATIQVMLEADNPELLGAQAEPAADGDAHLEWAALDTFRIPACPRAAGC